MMPAHRKIVRFVIASIIGKRVNKKQRYRTSAQEKRRYLCAVRPRNGLCVGLDVDLERLPRAFRGSVADFNAAIIRATRSVAACYKINLAFYEKLGRAGLDALYATRELIGDSYVIADAKRGDIGNTSAAYASAIFDDLKADAVTVSPYMGRDSVEPFLAVPGRMVYVLALTSNPGSADFQRLMVDVPSATVAPSGKTQARPLFEHVIETSLAWQRAGDIGFVVGGTHPRELSDLRAKFPDAAFLIPGLGSQGAGEDAMVQANAGGDAVFNVSRGLIYISDAEDFEEKVREEAERIAKVVTI